MSVEAGASSAVAGVTAIDERVAELTFSGAEPPTDMRVAEILAIPGAIAVATALPLIVATLVVSDVQTTSLVITCEAASLNNPVAEKFCLVPGAIVRPGGVTEMDTIVASVTANCTEVVTLPRVAVIVTNPGAIPLARPVLEPIVATVVSDELQVA